LQSQREFRACFPLDGLKWSGRLRRVNEAALGVFDSGVGGLTVVRAIQDLLPAETIVYLGDTARLPYGSKSPETIRRFAMEDARFLLQHEVKAIVVACNTATAHALPVLRDELPVPVIGVIEAGVEAVLADPSAERIGVIATRGTIRSHAYQHALAQRRTGLIIHAVETPLLVPFIEEDWIDHPAARLVLQQYLEPLVQRGIDTLLLACTHYPLLLPLLGELLPADVRVVDSATTCAEHLRRELDRSGMLADPQCGGHLDVYLSDLSAEFEQLAGRFLERRPGRVRRAAMDALS
jgi:glutamate racemase